MANQQHISPNKKDRDLAQEIGRALPNTENLTELNDPLMNSLLSFKKAQKDSESSVDSDRIWTAIQSEIDAKPQKSASILTLYPAFKRFAVAASILIAALLAFWIYQANRGDILVGESLASTEIVELHDGSLVTLRPHSKLYQTSISAENHSYHLTGEAYFEVSTNPDRIFSVSTSQSKVEVLGTKFVLSDWGNISEVFLEEGRVRFTSTSTQQSVELDEGEASSVSTTQKIRKIKLKDASEYKDWLTNELVFRNKSAEFVFKELEQHFNIRIEKETPLDQDDLSGSIQLDNLQSVMQNLELVLNGNFTQTGERSYSFHSNE